MEFKDVKRYIDEVKESDGFKELDDFTRMTEIKENEDIYSNIRYYLSIYHPRHDCKEFFQPNYEHFIAFLEHYLKSEYAEIVFDDNGNIDLSRTLHLVRPRMFCGGGGDFIDNHIILTNGDKYICKLPLNYKGNSGMSKYCIYSPLIASYIAKKLNISSAEISLASVHNGRRILSKNFLKSNEEIVTYIEDPEDLEDLKISEHLRNLEEALRLRKFPIDEIQKVKFDFLKQEFLAKLIGLKDQRADNSPVIVSLDEDYNRHVKMAPMFDFDYSFHIANHVNMLTRKCDNGKDDIGSLIEQYKYYPGFKEFVTSSIKSFDMLKVFRQIFEDTGCKAFRDYEEDEQMMGFINFVSKNLQVAKEAISIVYEGEREDK